MSDWIKVFRVAMHAVLLAVNETGRNGGVCAVRLEGRVFGVRGEAVKHFPTPAAADSFFEALDKAAVEDWWRSMMGRVDDEFTGFVERGMPGDIELAGLRHA